ncbi:MAG: apolipoprotein N-acyltransferase [Nitrospirae bacterium]|nr:apolipoprotein N-acyltransferase [Nitrospirota bacterium]
MTKLTPWGLAFLSGVLCVLSFPRFDLEFLAWFALVPLFFALENQPVRKSFWLGWLSGTVYFLGTVHWVTNTMIRYGKLPAAVSYPIMLLFVVYLGLYVGIFATLFVFLRRRTRFPAVLTAPALWTSLELLRTYALSGFPWAGMGYSQYLTLPVIQIADITGVYGVSFLVVMINIGVMRGAVILKDRSFHWPTWRPVITAFLLVSLNMAYGAWRLAEDRASDAPTLRVGVAQANIPQDVKWDAPFRQTTIDRYERLTRDLASQSVGLIVWPEAAMPFLFEEDKPFQQQVIDLVKTDRTPLLFGSPSVTTVADRLWMFNSAYLLSADGRIANRYDKMHLVPFGEYVPLSTVLSFVNKMVEGIGDFLPGRDYTLFQLPDANFGTVICYEVIFPDFVRRFVKEGATLMTTITNDSWFGDSAAPYQHFSMVVFRAVENRVPFARAANTGISGFIDRTGRIRKAGPIFVEAALADTLRLRTTTTFYTQYGDVFAYACVILSLFMIYTAIRIDPKGEEFSYA